jgi:predicted O-methyltransferase YrrM
MLSWKRTTQVVKNALRRALLSRGWRLERRYPIDIAPHVIEIVERVAPLSGYSLLAQPSPERYAALCNAVEYVVEHEVPGSIVECGVYKGASMMAAALALVRLGRQDRDLYLFDTFAGMPAPGDRDVTLVGRRAAEIWGKRATPGDGEQWLGASVDEVRRNMLDTGYDESKIHFVAGRVEDTLPALAPSEIALLRLDTDWYESTRHELVHLFPRLSRGGVLIIDDYGHWAGAREATDEFFRERGIRILLDRVDYTARTAVKQWEDTSE